MIQIIVPTLRKLCEIILSSLNHFSIQALEDFLEGCAHYIHGLTDIWDIIARAEQRPPEDKDWLMWLLLGGRGSGKTRAGAEWVRARVQNGAKRIALVAPTYNDAREVMIEGESGLLNIGPAHTRPTYYPSRRRLEWPNGSIGHVFSAEDPNGLRGPQFDTAWADEFCAWTYPDDTLSNLRLALRLSTSTALPPRLTITTTPKSMPALKELIDDPTLRLSRMGTKDNADNLAPGFVAAMESKYGGTRLGRQELDGIIIDDHPGALWNRALIERVRIPPLPLSDYRRIILAIDPPASHHSGSNACGIIVAGLVNPTAHSHESGNPNDRSPITSGMSGVKEPEVHILHDGTVQGLTPQGWAQRACALSKEYGADYMLAEVNQGGDMVSTVIKTIDRNAVIRCVRAKHSKRDRAMPVAMLYEQSRVKHIKPMPELEDELCQLGANKTVASNDRADALVWAVSDLLLSPPRPKIRWIWS